MIDGVIKYSIAHQIAETPDFKHYKALESVRSNLFTLGVIGELDGVGYGNISIRYNNSKAFFITATQTGSRQTLDKEFYTYVYEYDFFHFKLFSKGLHKPSSEALSHALIYSLDEQIDAVIHIHSPELWQFMQEQNYLFTQAEYGTREMVQEIKALYRNKDPFHNNIFVMKGHKDGIICFGKNILEAQRKIFQILHHYLKEVHQL